MASSPQDWRQDEKGIHTLIELNFFPNQKLSELKQNKNSPKPRSKKIPAAAAVLCSSWCGPVVLTGLRSLGGALAPSKTLQVPQLDRADVTSVWSIKATSTTLLV